MVFFQYEMSINNNNEMDKMNKIDFTKIAYCDFCNVSNEWWEMYYVGISMSSELPNCCADCAENYPFSDSDSDSDSDDE